MLNQNKFGLFLNSLIFNKKNQTFLLAVSGGADSMVLSQLFKNLNLKFQIAHVNYKLRGKDSDADEKLVKNFCDKNHVKLHIYKVSENDKKPEKSIQLWARKLRYDFFREIISQENLNFLVTAHHLNDQLETFLINLSRGSGMKGLSGIPANENHILRPLLIFSKQEIYDYAEEHQIDFREDLSNKKNDYLRNRIRNKIVPELLQTNNNFLDNFEKSITIIHQSKIFINKKIDEILAYISSEKNESIVLNKNLLHQESDFVKFEILKKFGFKNETEINKIFLAETGKNFYSAKWHLLINRNEIILSENAKKTDQMTTEIIICNHFDFSKPENTIHLSDFQEYKNSDTEYSEKEWHFNAEALLFPLKIRTKKNGDMFSPIGMIGKKKVSKFFKDEKIPNLAKQNIWLLCDAHDRVLGIIPMRQDKRFAADKNDSYILKIKI